MPAKKKTAKKADIKKKEVKLTKPKLKKSSSVAKTPKQTEKQTEKQTAEKLAHDKTVRAAKGGAVVVDTVSEKREGKDSYSVVIRGGKAVKVLDSVDPDLY